MFLLKTKCVPFNFVFIKESLKNVIMVSINILSSTTVFNIDINNNKKHRNQHNGMISEGSDQSNDC